MIEIKINSKEYKVPTTFDDITMSDYCRCFYGLKNTENMDDRDKFIWTKRNEATVVSRLLGEDDEFCLDLPLPIFNELGKCCRFIYSLQTLKHQNKIEVNGVTYYVPKPSEFNLRQWIDVDVTTQDNESPTKYLELLSTLLMRKDNDGNWIHYSGDNKVNVDLLKNMKASDGLGIVYHFFLKGEISKRSISTYSMVQEVIRQLHRNITSS